MNPPRLRPFATSAPDRYSRLLPPDREAAYAATDARLKCLVRSMQSKSKDDTHVNGIPAGYTYFGQFIDHDLTHDTSALPEDGVETIPANTINFRRTGLNLDNIYGDGPGSRDSKLYDEDNASFRLGIASGNCGPREFPVFDVPLDDVCSDPSSRRALAADPRNLENVLVRQVHSMFLRLHNIAVAELKGSFPARECFFRAREKVCHQYQWLVRHDFLPRFCDHDVYEKVVTQANPLVDWNGGFSVPVEFAQAAFRFGHSMIRPRYTLGVNENNAPLGDLFGGKDTTGPLSCEHTINWTNFLLPEGSEHLPWINPETARRIDRSIIPALFDIPIPALEAFVRLQPSEKSAELERALPFRTLKRGVASKLPSGQKARIALHERKIFDNNDAWADLEDCELEKNTPLWYYVLLEAEVNEGGLRLGPVGSRLIAEVIEGALWASSTSFLRRYGRLWTPDPWPTECGKHTIRSLHDVAVVVGLADPIP